MSENDEKNPLPRDLQEPSEKGFAQVDEMIAEFGLEAETAGPASDFAAREEVVVDEPAVVPDVVQQGADGQRFRNRARQLEGKQGLVVGHAFVGAEGTPNAGKICRGVQLHEGDVITIPEEKLRGGKTSVSFCRMSQAAWDKAVGKPKKKRPPGRTTIRYRGGKAVETFEAY